MVSGARYKREHSFRQSCLAQLRRAYSDDTRQLIECYSDLVGDYSKGQLDRSFINNVKLRNSVSSKISMIRSSLRKQGRKRN